MKPKELYLGSCVQELNDMAEKIDKNTNPKIYLKSMLKIVEGAQKADADGDQEKAYVLFMRYCSIFQLIIRSREYAIHKTYYDSMLNRSQITEAMDRIEELQKRLSQRFEEREAMKLLSKRDEERRKEEAARIEATPAPPSPPPGPLSQPVPAWLTPNAFVELLRSKRSPLVFDLRPKELSEAFPLKAKPVICLDPAAIPPSATVRHIEAALQNDPSALHRFERRADATHVVLIDEASKAPIGGPLKRLKEALLMYDARQQLKEEPLAVEGGFENLFHLYPNLVSNAQKYREMLKEREKATVGREVEIRYPDLEERHRRKRAEEQRRLEEAKAEAEMEAERKRKQAEMEATRKRKQAEMEAELEAERERMQAEMEATRKRRQAATHSRQLNGEPTAPDRRLKPREADTEAKPAVASPSSSRKKSHKHRHTSPMSKEQPEGASSPHSKDKEEGPAVAKKKDQQKGPAAAPKKKDHKVGPAAVPKKADQDEGPAPTKKDQDEDQPPAPTKKEKDEKAPVPKTKDQEEESPIPKTKDQEEESPIPKTKDQEEGPVSLPKKSILKTVPSEGTKDRLETSDVRKDKREEANRGDDQPTAPTVNRALKPVHINNHNDRDLKNAVQRDPVIGHSMIGNGSTRPPAHPTSRVTKQPLKDEHCSSSSSSSSNGGARLKRSGSQPNLALSSRDDSSSGEAGETSSSYSSRGAAGGGPLAAAASASSSRQRPLMPSRESKPRAFETDLSQFDSETLRLMNADYGTTERGLTGLRNLGNSCYMNSVLQALSNTPCLVRYIVSNNYRKDINRSNPSGYGGEIAEEFATLLRALWAGRYRIISPIKFKRTVGRKNCMFANHEQQDSQEFLLFLLDGLHEDFNAGQSRRGAPTAPAILEDEKAPLEDRAQEAWRWHERFNRSFVVSFFQGQFRSTVRCLTCRMTSTTFDVFMYLSLQIPSHSRCSLRDCISQFSKEERMTGSSQWHCPRCRQNRDAVKHLAIWRLPPYLLIHLKRFSFEQSLRAKMNTLVDFPLQELHIEQEIGEPRIYDLYAVSNHYGSMESGHYTAYCLNPGLWKWFKFDDDVLSPIAEHHIRSSAAYILFYATRDGGLGRNEWFE